MTAVASLLWIDAFRVLRALLGAVALSVEAMQSPDLPFEPWVHQQKGHPGQIAVAAYLRGMLEGSAYTQPSGGQSCYSLRCAPQGLGQVWEALEDGRAVVEREINSANDNPLIDPETGGMYKAGNFYGGHIARLLDTWKIDFASMANWGNALMAVLVDDRFNQGLPANLTPEPGLNSGFKGMQLSVTSLACAVRQMAGPSSIHSLPTEQYNQDVVSLGMHAAVTAMDALECLRNETAMVLLAAAQAVDLRGGPAKLGRGSRTVLRSRAPTGAVPGPGPAHGARSGGGIGQDRRGTGIAENSGPDTRVPRRAFLRRVDAGVCPRIFQNPQNPSSNPIPLALHSGFGGTDDPLETRRAARFSELDDSVRHLVSPLPVEESQRSVVRYPDEPRRSSDGCARCSAAIFETGLCRLTKPCVLGRCGWPSISCSITRCLLTAP